MGKLDEDTRLAYSKDVGHLVNQKDGGPSVVLNRLSE